MRKQLRDEQWKQIEGMLPGKVGDRGRSAADNRLFVEAVLWIARTGSPWRDLPPEFGSWNSTYQRFARWSRAGVWHRVFAALARERRFREVFIDSTIVRAHQHAAGAPKNGAQALGRSRGGLTTKIHVVVDAVGRLIQGRVSAGQVHDITQAGALLDGVPAKCVVADKAYDAMALRQQIAAIPAKVVIPPRANRREPIRWSKAIYKHRNLVERFFCRIKHFRRIATRYEKLAERFASFICLVGAIVCST